MKIGKLLKARENANEQDAIDFLVLNLIGWEDSATFWTNLRGKVIKKNAAPDNFRQSIENYSERKRNYSLIIRNYCDYMFYT